MSPTKQKGVKTVQMFDVAEAVDRDRLETSTRVYEARMARRRKSRAQLRSSRLARLLVRG